MLTNKERDLPLLYKSIVMTYLLKNGDGHLKNYGVIINENEYVTLCPTYDVICTNPYIPKDKPALTLLGKKVWHGKKELLTFGIRNFELTIDEADQLYQECIKALENSIERVSEYLQNNPYFYVTGTKMIDCWEQSLDQKSHKELNHLILRKWKLLKSDTPR